MTGQIKPPTLKEMQDHLEHLDMKTLWTMSDNWGDAFRLVRTAAQCRQGEQFKANMLAMFGTKPLSSL